VHADHRLDLESFTLPAFIFPTTPDKGTQGVLTKWQDPQKSGYGLFVDEDGCLACWIGDGKRVVKVSSGKPLLRKVWYLAAATYDAKTKRIKLYQQPVVTSANGGLGMSLLHPASETSATVSKPCTVKPKSNNAPLLMAAATKKPDSGRAVCGGHYKEALEPFALPEQCLTYNGKKLGRA